MREQEGETSPYGATAPCLSASLSQPQFNIDTKTAAPTIFPATCNLQYALSIRTPKLPLPSHELAKITALKTRSPPSSQINIPNKHHIPIPLHLLLSPVHKSPNSNTNNPPPKPSHNIP